MNKRQQGQAYERMAEQFLSRHRLKLVERNFSCRSGEIDLIMRQGKCFVFIEVKYRTHRHFGSASEAVNWHKQQKLKRTALFWLQKNGFSIDQTECRFDVVTIEGQEHHIEWHTNILVEG
ncbi:YraN family protein [Photobacterium lucens]|uniref:YraN family protein n=1 Tax=Photobacterium lucens TaxID=2562949 RepID=UPI0021598989|nr:YraN family protein [Photobacterium lucens]